MPVKRTTAKKSTTKTYQVKGKDVVAKIKEIIRAGNARRITVADQNGKTIVVLPLTVGVLGAILAPPLVVIGAIAALIGECSITVEK